MGPAALERVRVRRAARGVDAPAIVRALERGDWGDRSTLLKREGASWVRRAKIAGSDVVVKCRGLERTGALLKAGLGFGRGDRHWYGAALLASKKIATARPLLLGHGLVDGQRAEVIVLEALSGRTLLEHAARAARGESGVREQHRVAAAAGVLVRTFAERGLWNRDHKPSNQIVVDTGDDARAAEIAVIDCVAVRRAVGPVAGIGIVRMMAQLWIEPTGCGVRPRRALVARALVSASSDREQLRDLARAALLVVEAHGDMRPRVIPPEISGAGA
jgi:hypothetical protein